jgi:SAM-dependent methyltransferase
MTKREEAGKKDRSAKKRRRRGKRTQAQKADRHLLYERAVQDPEVDAKTLAKIYRRYRNKDAKVLREDFCGTGLLSTTWTKAKKSRRAIGIDLDAPTLEWGRKHHVKAAGKNVAKRVQLLEANVLDGTGAKADICAALNFSYQTFKQRDVLLKYFKMVRRRLKSDGIFVLDVLGGTEAMGEDENVHDLGDFTYRWEQASFDPLTHDFECHIHFEFADGSKISPAFTYIWRLWTMPELTDLLMEAGFSAVHRLWEKTDRKGEGTGAFYEPKRVENQESWWTYLVAER